MINAELSLFINNNQTAIAINNGEQTIVALATIQVLSLFGFKSHILSSQAIEHPLNFPDESVLILAESQIPQLSLLRQQKFVGGVVIISSVPLASLLKKHYYILRYGTNSSVAWQFPWLLPDLLSKLTKLKPLSQGNINLFKQEMEAVNERVDRELESVLIEIERLHPQNPYFVNQLNYIQQTVENLFSKTPLARHVLIELEGYSTATIQHHFRTLCNEIEIDVNSLAKQKILLNQVLADWQKQVQCQAEDIQAFLNS